MSAPEFEAGQSGEIARGVQYRVVEGRKGPTDLRLDVRTDGWIAAPMALGFILADFFRQNEDRLYPPQYGWRGGGKYMSAVIASAKHGWRRTVADLNAEKAEREARRRRDAA